MPQLQGSARHAAVAQGHAISYARHLQSLVARSHLTIMSRETPVMKAEGHPNYDFITIVMTDGSTYRTRSTMGKDGATLNLDIDPKSHPAWTGGTGQLMDRAGRVSRFNEKFKGFMRPKPAT
jgi:large subunit ribosomal protein L31